MGIFDFFKNKDNNASLNIITLEDSIAYLLLVDYQYYTL